MKAKRAKIDVSIAGSMGFYLFRLETRRAVQWVLQNVAAEPWQCAGHAFACDDTRMAQDIAQAMTDSGLRVQ